MCLGVLVEAQLEDSTLTDRAYVVLEKQNLGKILQRDAVWALVLDPTRSKKSSALCLFCHDSYFYLMNRVN